MNAIDRCLRHNARYVKGFGGAGLAAPPARRLAVVACMDARLETGRMLGLREGDAHVIRNAGGLVTDDVIRSLAISQQLLGTREVMVIQHTDCGMAKLSEGEMRAAIERGTGARPGFELGAFGDLEHSLRSSLMRLRDSPLIARGTSIRGFVFEVETGRLRELR